MSNSLRDQLLKAGLVSKKHIEEAEQKQEKNERKRAQKKAPAKSTQKQSTKNKQKNAKPTSTTSKRKTQKPTNNDLAKFYAERKRVEQQEKADALRKEREAAALRKKNRQRVRSLITQHKVNNANAAIRYNFQVGTRIKFTYVTKEQQKQLATGELAITFLDGERCLIPLSIIDDIRQLEPKKIIVLNDSNTKEEDDLWGDIEWPEDITEDKTKKE